MALRTPIENESMQEEVIIKNNEIDLVAILRLIWNGRKTIYYTLGLTILTGVIFMLVSPPKYTVNATLLPSSEKKSGSLGGLSALAGMAGVNIGSMMGESSTIPSEIYPQVVNSYPFLNEFIHEKYNFEGYDDQLSLYEYSCNDTIEGLGDKIIKYTFLLPWTIKDALLGNDNIGVQKDYGVVILSEDEQRVLKKVQGLIKIEVDIKTGVVSIAAEANEPILTAQYVQKSLDLLQKYVINYKTKQARENLMFVNLSYEEKKKEYEKLQMDFFKYKDMHRNIISERSSIEFQRLSDEYELASTIYFELAKQLEQAKISVKEETPAFTVLEPAKVPIEKSSPRKFVILTVSIILGLFVGMSILFGKLVWKSLRSRLYN